MKLRLENVRLAFPNLFTAKAASADKPNDLTFSAAFIFPPDHPARKQLNEGIQAVAKEKWGAKSPDILKSAVAGDKLCLHNGDSKSEYEGYGGNFFVNARSKTRPLVIDTSKAPLVEADGKPYAGCYVNASIELWAQDNSYGKRVNASLRGVQFVRDGDAFTAGGAPADESEFDSIEEGAHAEASLV